MRICLDSPGEDLAFRFKIFAGYASKMFTAITIFLARELKPLIYWPTPEQTLSYKQTHFSGNFNKVEGIGDCTEQWIQRSSNPKAQYQTYSKLSIKLTALIKVITLSRSLLFVPKVVPLVIYQTHMQVQQQIDL